MPVKEEIGNGDVKTAKVNNKIKIRTYLPFLKKVLCCVAHGASSFRYLFLHFIFLE